MTLIFAYVVGMPAIIYFFQWYQKCDICYGYFDLLSAYGYSISIFVPVTVCLLIWLAKIVSKNILRYSIEIPLQLYSLFEWVILEKLMVEELGYRGQTKIEYIYVGSESILRKP
jgi:hypothetical protein